MNLFVFRVDSFNLKAQSIMKFFVFLLLICGVMLPSDGDHGILSPKSLCFLLMNFAWIMYLAVVPTLKPKLQRLLVFFMSFVLFLTLWLVIGAPNQEQAMGQYKVFLVTLFTGTVIIFCIESKIFSYETFSKIIIGSNFIYSFTKVLCVSLHILKIVDIFQLLEKLGFRFMSMGILGSLVRLQTSVDIISPFILYFVLTSSSWGVKLNPRFKSLFVLIAWMSIILSFSRYLILTAALAHVAFWITENRKPLAISCLKFLCVASTLIVFIGPVNVWTVVEKRFFSTEVDRSDQTRETQIRELMTVFEASPYVGQGMGGYAEKAIRDDRLKYSYEVQWVAFLMQFGIFGITLLLLPIVLLFIKMLLAPPSRSKFSLFIIFLLWILSGFTNPFLISLTSGIVYALFYGATLKEETVYVS